MTGSMPTSRTDGANVVEHAQTLGLVCNGSGVTLKILKRVHESTRPRPRENQWRHRNADDLRGRASL